MGFAPHQDRDGLLAELRGIAPEIQLALFEPTAARVRQNLMV